MAWVSCNLGDLLISPADLEVFYTNANYKISNTGDLNYTHLTMNVIPKTFFTSRANTFILGDATNGIKIVPASGNYWLELWHNNSRHVYLDLRLDWGSGQNLIVAGYDDTTQKGTLYNIIRYNGFSGSPPYDNVYDGIQNFTNSVNNNIIYQILKNINIPTYNWQSVPSISGKNGILQSLVQIKDSAINSGEPVSNAPLTSFDSLGNINIPSVIDEQMPVDPSNPTSVTITYLIPVLEYGSYSYIKVAIKKNSIPLSLEDADRVVDLDEPTTITRIGSETVSNLDEESHYYFVIFIEDELGNTASSEPKSCETGIKPPAIGIFKTVIQIGGGVVEDTIKEQIIIEKV